MHCCDAPAQAPQEVVDVHARLTRGTRDAPPTSTWKHEYSATSRNTACTALRGVARLRHHSTDALSSLCTMSDVVICVVTSVCVSSSSAVLLRTFFSRLSTRCTKYRTGRGVNAAAASCCSPPCSLLMLIRLASICSGVGNTDGGLSADFGCCSCGGVGSAMGAGVTAGCGVVVSAVPGVLASWSCAVSEGVSRTASASTRSDFAAEDALLLLLLLGVFFVADVSMLSSSLLFSCMLDIGMSGDVDSDARLSKDDDDDLEASPFSSETLRETRAFLPAPDAFFAECARYVVNAGETGSRFSWSPRSR